MRKWFQTAYCITLLAFDDIMDGKRLMGFTLRNLPAEKSIVFQPAGFSNHRPRPSETQFRISRTVLPCLNLALIIAGSVSSKYQRPSGRATALAVQRKVSVWPDNPSVSRISISCALPQSATGSKGASERTRRFCCDTPLASWHEPSHWPMA